MYASIKIKRVAISITLLTIIMTACLLMSSINPLTVEVSVAEKTDALKLPIIMYHSILKDETRHGKYVISPNELEKDLKYIKESGYTTVTANDLIAYVEGKGDLPKKPIMLTFDDGYYNNYLYAYPLLKKYRSKAVIGIIGTYTQQYSDTPDENAYYSHCTWYNIKEILSSGLVDIENHSYNLHKSDGDRLGTERKQGESFEDYKKLLTEDINKLQKAFKDNLDITSYTFIYPFGVYSDGESEILKELGFKCTLTCNEKMNYIVKDPECLHFLGRYIRTSDRSVEKIVTSN